MAELAEKAELFATDCHGRIGQRRKYTHEPYIRHPAEVVSILQTVPHTEAMLAAAWLHDVVEDTLCSLSDVEAEFGPEVARLVDELTDVSKPQDGKRSVRKALDREHLANASPEAKTVKLADLISNCRSIIEHDPDFARVYLEEKRLLLQVLKEGDATLWQLANAITFERYPMIAPAASHASKGM